MNSLCFWFSSFKKVLPFGVLVLASQLVGCRSPFSNGKGEVTFAYVPIALQTEEDGVPATADTRTWYSPVLIDSSDIVSTTQPYDTGTSSGYGHANNVLVGGLPGALHLIPVNGGFDIYGRAFAGISLFDQTAPDDPTSPTANLRYQMVVSSALDFTRGLWDPTSDYNSFQTVGAAVSTAATSPAGGVHLSFATPSTGDVHGFLIKETADGYGSLFATKRYASTSYTTDAWVNPRSPTQINASGSSLYINRTLDAQCLPRSATHSSGMVILGWCGAAVSPNGNYFLSVYNPSLALGSGAWASPSILLDSTSGATAAGVTGGTYTPGANNMENQNLAVAEDPGNLGIDVALNASGQGLVAYAAAGPGNANAVLFAQIFSVSTGLSSVRIPLHSYLGGGVRSISQPRIWLKDDGSAIIFFYRYDGTTTQLYSVSRGSNVGSTLGNWSPAVRMDDVSWQSITPSFRYGDTHAFRRVHGPALAFAGNHAIVAYVQSQTSGGLPRLRVMTSDSTSPLTWTSPRSLDDSWGSDGVGQFHIAGANDPRNPGHALFMVAFEGLTAGIPVSVQARMFSSKAQGFTPQNKVSGTLNANYADPTTAINSQGLGSVFFHALPDVAGLAGVYFRAYSAGYR